MPKFLVSYRVRGTIEIEADDEEHAKEVFDETAETTNIIDGLGSDGDGFEITDVRTISQV